MSRKASSPPPGDRAVLDLLSGEGRPMSAREVIRRLGVPTDARPALRRRMRALAEEGVLVRMRSRYALPASLAIFRGTFRGHRMGFGFVAPEGEEAGRGDILVGRGRVRGAMDGDRVSVRVEKVGADGRREGSVVEILERARASLVGRFVVEGRRAWVEPQEERILYPVFVGPKARGGARDGEWVEVEIRRHPAPGQDAEGRIVRSFGYPEDPAVEQRMIISKWELREAFPAAALREAEACRPPAEDEPFPEGVEDLRGLTAFTIDPATARDRDDAISIQPLPAGGRRLGVHIADVSHYVRAGSAVDKEAAARGNSVYFPDRAMPMLPPKLTGEVCSLSGGDVRRTLTAFLDFDAEGRRTGFRLTFGRIRSRAELTYRGAGAVLEGREIPEAGESARAEALREPLSELAALARRLRARRMAEGSLDFEMPEAVVLLDAEGGPAAIERAPRNEAHRLIEECMLAANRAVAERLAEAGGPGVFRVHEPPDEEKVQSVRLVLARLGIPAPSAEALMRPGGMQGVLDAVHGQETERYVNLLCLRSMKLARYEAEPALHFGLGFERYTHFTSPIRRYADLLVHRRLTRLLHGDRWRAEGKRLARLCEWVSERERAAEGAEREMVDFHKALFMKDRIGERFVGHVSGAAAFGIFVELEDIFVEGMAPLEWLTDDYYRFLPEEHAVLGSRTGRRLRLGDPVTVRVMGVDLAHRQVTFQLQAGGVREAARGEEGEPARGRLRSFGMRKPQRERAPGGRKRRPAVRRRRRGR